VGDDVTREEIVERSTRLTRLQKAAIDVVCEVSDPGDSGEVDYHGQPARDVAGFVYRLLVELISQHEQSGIDSALTDALHAFVVRCGTEIR
jgi:hypothetical protein